MREGLLWFDNDPKRTPGAKLDAALRRFEERHGRRANCCHVAPAAVFTHPLVTVLADPAMLRNHFLVGWDEELAPQRREKRAVEQPATAVAEPVVAEPAAAVARRAGRARGKSSATLASTTTPAEPTVVATPVAPPVATEKRPRHVRAR